MNVGSALKIEVVMPMRLASCDSRTGTAEVNLRIALSRKYQTSHPTYSRKKSEMNDACETGLVLSNSVMRMRIVTIPSRLHALSVFLWLAHYG
jgi:hypothetical protein